jgi:hypothetical protein
MSWKRLNYLTHRWIGIALGLLMLAWFVSGVVMMYYPYPVLTESERDGLLQPFRLDAPVVPFSAAVDASLADHRVRAGAVVTTSDSALAGGRLIWWMGRPAWQVLHQRGYRIKPWSLVDAFSGRVLSPLDSAQAMEVARAAAPAGSEPVSVRLLPRGDHYMFWGAYHLEDFPVWQVRFDDPRSTFVYVGRETGRVYARADVVARLLTWVGTVPHWLYFMRLYEHPALWTWLNLVLPGVAVLISLTGIVLGTYQLFPKRRRGSWRVSAYHGVSIWHHLSGVVFGLLVFAWTLSGVFEMLGAGNDPRAGQADMVRGGPVAVSRMSLSPTRALSRAAARYGVPAEARFVDVAQLLDRPGYRIRLAGGEEAWVDAETGSVRGELSPREVAAAAARVLPGHEVTAVDRMTEYDTYYYHRHGREMHLPVWRVTFDDPETSVVYLDTVTGTPTGFVAADTRLWRWLRDGMHSLDFPALIRRRPLWDLVVLPLMIGGTLSCVTGVWLLLRRLRRIKRRARMLTPASAAPPERTRRGGRG